MKKLAIPVIGKTLSPHFGQCEHFKFFEVKNHKVIHEEIIKAPEHKPGLLPNWLIGKKVTDVITGGIGHKAIEIFNQNKINVFVGVEVKDSNELVNDYLEGTLETNGNFCNH